MLSRALGVRRFATTAVASQSDYSISSAFANAVKNNKMIAEEESKKEKRAVSPVFLHNMSRQATYDPFDFSYARMKYEKWVQYKLRREKLKNSTFNSPEVNPLDFYTMPRVLSSYLSTSGQILHHRVTGLKQKKQKSMAKAVKRCRAFGLMSSVGKDVSRFPKRGSEL